jgi:uncharacterized protein (DUF1778 family)
MTHAVQRERIEMRVDSETKNMAERASAALGCASLTEYMIRLIRDNAPKVLGQEASIQLTNTQFDNFIAICNDVELMPSDRIMAAAKRLDTEGF